MSQWRVSFVRTVCLGAQNVLQVCSVSRNIECCVQGSLWGQQMNIDTCNFHNKQQSVQLRSSELPSLCD